LFSFRLINRVGITKTDSEEQKFIQWNPTGDDYIFWQDGHLYYSESVNSAKSVRISDGRPNWDHGSTGALWSVKGQKLAFLSHDKTKQKSIYMTSYSKKEKYPIVVELEYPKTHEKQPQAIVVNIWDKKTRSLKQMDVQLRNRKSETDSVLRHLR
ncbi:hypothetical protein ANCDUO_21478, partial [Ancylostoma duodenale]